MVGSRWLSRGSETGSALPLMAFVVVAAGLAVTLIGRLGAAATDRAAATTAADAAALAGAADGEEAARRLAAENGAELESFEAMGTDAQVEVRLGAARSVARARRSRGELGGSSTGPLAAGPLAAGLPSDRIAPVVRAALGRAEHFLGKEVRVVAVDQTGLSIDVAVVVAGDLARIGPLAGLCQPDPGTKPRRFEVCPTPQVEP